MKLYEHQEQAIKQLDSGKILCGGVGSGKSLTALVYYIRKEKARSKGLAIITTARKRDTQEWEAEMRKVGLPSDSVIIDSWNNIGKYKDISGAFFIFDEQRVVGSGTWVKSFLKIARGNRWILLSATPGDTWSDYIPVFLANGFFRNRTDFLRNHAVFSRVAKYPKIDRYFGTKKLERLRDSILVDMIFERETVPHHQKVNVFYDRDLYKSVMKNRWNPYENTPIIEAGELCYILRKVVNSNVSRLDAVAELLHLRRKAIVFYNFDYELDLLRALCAKEKISCSEWNGHKHEGLPDGEQWAYLVQYTAGAEGWNCTQTDTMIFYSASYSYKQMVQAAGRIDRMNTPFTDLYFYHLRSTASIDLAIEKALSMKKNFNERIFVNKS